jgi:hypothetical protein
MVDQRTTRPSTEINDDGRNALSNLNLFFFLSLLLLDADVTDRLLNIVEGHNLFSECLGTRLASDKRSMD